MTDAEILAQPLTLGSSERLPNRLVKAAMTEGLADPQGRPTQALARLYRLWAEGGAGLLITGNVLIDRDHLERPGNVILDRAPDGQTIAALKQWAQAARSGGAGLWAQLSHAGRQTPIRVNPRPKAPSAAPLALPGKQFGAPEALSEAEILELIGRYAGAAAALREAGFTGVQIHAAHGYLISQFLSPRANLRTDAWGGSLENRARLLLDAVRAVRSQAGRDFTVSVKLNSADFQKGGFGPDESLAVAGLLEAAGVDCLEISGGTYEQPRMMDMDGLEKPDFTGLPASTAAREAYFLDFALAMRTRVSIPIMVTGGFRSAAAMAQAVREGVALIGLGRPLCVAPEGPARLLAGAAALPRPEAKLAIGPGWLGPRSPIGAVKALNGFGALYWYYQQLRRLGAGAGVDPRLSVLAALSREQADQARWLKAAGR